MWMASSRGSDGVFFRRRGAHGAPGVTVERVAEPSLELSGPVSLPDGAGTAFYFLRGQHAAKLERNQRERRSVSIFDGGMDFGRVRRTSVRLKI